MNKQNRLLSYCLLLLAYCFLVLSLPNGLLVAPPVHAQLSSLGIATYLPINAERVEDGDIVIATDKGYFLSSKPYEQELIGVVSTSPSLALQITGQDGYPVVDTGTTLVKATGEGGNIAKGDLITTSSIPGTGMKAEGNGFVLGRAVDEIEFDNPEDISFVLVDLNIHLSNTVQDASILDILSIDQILSGGNQSRLLQFTIAGIILLSSFGVGFVIFAKVINTGIEALGRNPLAGRRIQLSIIFNVMLVIIVVVLGATLAYIVLRL